MAVDISQLPIPDWDITCPHCRYPLRGLPTHRCPECGRALDMSALVKSWTRVRAPRFTGDESPLPDFGLTCRKCRAQLVESTAGNCRVCRAPFSTADRRPTHAWFQIEPWMQAGVTMPLVELTLEQEAIPFFALDSRSFADIVIGQRSLGARVMVASEFYFDALHAIRAVGIELARTAFGPQREWQCPQCREVVPPAFDICWSCQHARP